MQYGNRLAEGKTKIIYAHADDPALVVLVHKDSISAGDGARRNEIAGKGALSGRTAANVFTLLNRSGVPTHFVADPGPNEMIARRCAMIPVEVVIRRRATGSYLKRHADATEGMRFDPLLVEFFIKDDANHDPQISEAEMIERGVVTADELDAITGRARQVFEILERAWAAQDVELIDLKIEFGRDDAGNVLVADMIDNDSWRLWPGGDKNRMLDKQIYRNMAQVDDSGLATVKSKYQQVAELTDRFRDDPAQARA